MPTLSSAYLGCAERRYYRIAQGPGPANRERDDRLFSLDHRSPDVRHLSEEGNHRGRLGRRPGVVDPEAEATLDRYRYRGRTDYSLWEGRKVRDIPVMTFSRGQLAMENGSNGRSAAGDRGRCL